MEFGEKAVVEKFILIGDCVLFKSEQEGEECIISKGNAEDQVVVKPTKDKESVFKIVPMMQYTARKVRKDKSKRKVQLKTTSFMGGPPHMRAPSRSFIGGPLPSLAAEEEVGTESKQMETYERMESANNDKIISQLSGKPLHYGQIVQLLHVQTSKFLIANMKEDSSWAKLKAEGSQKSHFKVLPHGTIKRIGDKVSENDAMLFVHVKSGGVLHQDTHFDETDAYGINLRSTGTVWTMCLSDFTREQESSIIKTTMPLRLYHQEAGYIKAVDTRVLCKVASLGNKDANGSYDTVWEVEAEVKTATGDIGWNKPCFFRLYGTDSYLSFDPNTDDETEPTMVLVSGSERNNPNATFVIVPAQKDPHQKDQDDLTLGSWVKIQSLSKKWLQTTPHTLKYQEITGTRTFHTKDKVQIQQVPRSQLEDYEYVHERIPKLYKFLDEGPLKGNKAVIMEAQTALHELILFSGGNSTAAPHIFEEISPTVIKPRQKLLFAAEVVDLLLMYLRIGDIDIEVLRLVYALLKTMAKGNNRIATALSKQLTVLKGTSAMASSAAKLGIASTIIEVYKDNRVLLESLTETDIEDFIYVLKLTRDAKYLELLSEICLCGKEPLPNLQKMVCHKLLEKNPDMMYKTEVKHNTIDILLPEKKKKEEVVESDKEPTKQSLTKYLHDASAKEINYFEQSLVLYGNVCMGRNYSAINIVSKFCDYKECFLGLKDPDMPAKLRGCYCNIILHCYIECYPQKPYTQINYIWVPSKDSQPTNIITQKMSMFDPPPLTHPPIISNKPTNMYQFLLSYVMDRANLQWGSSVSSPTHTSALSFFLKVMVVMRYAFKYAFFKRDEFYLLARFKEILALQVEGRGGDFGKSQKILMARKLEDINLLVNIKLEVVKIMNLFLDLQRKQHLEEFLYNYSQNEDVRRSPHQLKANMLAILERDARAHPGWIRMDNDSQLCRVLLDLVRHENNQLTSVSLKLLLRIQKYQSQFAELYGPLDRLHILSSSSEISVYEDVCERLELLQKFTAKPMGSVERENVVRQLEHFTNLCASTNIQQIMSYLGIHKEVLGILKLTYRQEDSSADSLGVAKIFVFCYKFLTAFCKRNLTNQKSLYDYVQFMVNQLVTYGNVFGTVDTMCEIFRDNGELCLKFGHTPHAIEDFVRIVAAKDKDIAYIHFLKIIVCPDGNAFIRHNQDSVIKLILAMEDKIVPAEAYAVGEADKNKETVARHEKMRSLKMKEQSLARIYQRTSSFSRSEEQFAHPNYLLELLKLLISCAQKNSNAEAICRNILPLPVCLQLLTQAKLNDNLTRREVLILATYTQFFHDVYLNTDSSSLKTDVLILQTNEDFWQLLTHFGEYLESFIANKTQPPPDVAAQTNSLAAPLVEQLLVPNFLSIIESFFGKAFSIEKATQDQLILCSQWMDLLIVLANTRSGGDFFPSGADNSPTKSGSESADGSTKSGPSSPAASPRDNTPSPPGTPNTTRARFTQQQHLSELVVCAVQAVHAMEKAGLVPPSSNIEQLLTRIRREKAGRGRRKTMSLGHKQNNNTRRKPILLETIKQQTYGNVAQLLVLFEEEDEYKPSHLELLVYQLRNTLYHDQFMKIAIMRVLCALIQTSTLAERAAHQHTLTVLEAPLAVVGLLGPSDPQVASEALMLLLLMVDDGTDHTNPKPNLETKEYVISNFTSRPDEKFFQHLYELIQTAKLKLRDKKRNVFMYVEKKKERGFGTVSPKGKRLGTSGSDISAGGALNLATGAHRRKTTSSEKVGFTENVDSPPEKPQSKLLDKAQGSSSSGSNTASKTKLSSLMLGARFESFIGGSMGTFEDRELDVLGGDDSVVSEYHHKDLLDMVNMLRLLQLLSQGSSQVFRNYMRVQDDNFVSYDVVKEITLFLKAFEALVDTDLAYVGVAIETLFCLREVVKMNALNQTTVMTAQVLVPINHILLNPLVTLSGDKPLDLKIECIEFLLSLLDGADHRIFAKMIQQLDFTALENNTAALTSEELAKNEKAIKLASLSFRLIKILADSDTRQNKQLMESLATCEEHCKSRIGRIEIVNNNKLERVYFAIPASCKQIMVGQKSQEKIWKENEKKLQKSLEERFMTSDVEWNKPGEKLDAFMSWSEDTLVFMEHNDAVRKSRLANWVVTNAKWWGVGTHVMSIGINILLAVTSELNQPNRGIGTQPYLNALPLALVQLVFCFLMVGAFFVENGPVLFFEKWKKHFYDVSDQSFMLLDNPSKFNFLRTHITWWKFILISMRHFLTDENSLFHLAAAVCSILGLTVSNYFFAYHLFYYTVRSRALIIVLKALSLNKGTLLLLAVFICETVYIFSVISFLWFEDQYDPESSYCGSLMQCMATNLFYGIASGGQLVQFVWSAPWARGIYSIFWILFNLVFYFVSTVILLNVILSVIVDTFGQLRDKRVDTEYHKANYCFICSVEREVFQRKAIDFSKHVEDDHNKWHYLYFFAYLKERKMKRQDNQFTKQEEYVYKCINRKTASAFFPVERAMCLDNEGDSEEELHAKLFQKVCEMDTKLQSNNQKVQQLTVLLAAALEQIRSLKTQKMNASGASSTSFAVPKTPTASSLPPLELFKSAGKAVTPIKFNSNNNN